MDGKGWKVVKRLIKSTENKKFRRGSLTHHEELFLDLIQSKRKNGAKRAFIDVVQEAITREKLRDGHRMRRSSLTSSEASFIQELIDNEDLTVEQLERVDHVLNSDPLYALPDENISIPEQKSIEEKGEEELSKENKFKRYSVHLNGKDIEVLLKDVTFEDEEKKREIPTTPLGPSTYSYKAWDVLKDDPSEYLILGISTTSENKYVLSPPMMDSLRAVLPFSVSEDNFWLKYSMDRDGADLIVLYNSVRQSSRTLLAIETVNGEIFGSFTSSPWRNQRGFYGCCEAFIWRMEESRYCETSSVIEQAELESKLEIFGWSGENRNIQMASRGRIVVGGGKSNIGDEDDTCGFAIAIEKDLLKGTSSPCVTFSSPALSKYSSETEVFEILNVEVWSLTPCFDVELAEKLEMGRMFVLSHF